MTDLHVLAIDPARLDGIRAAGTDGHGNRLVPFPARGWEPLRCCLRLPDEGEPILLIAYAPFADPSPWREVGPVYVHAERCGGHAPDAGLPPQLRTGPRILRTYRADRTLAYDDITYVAAGQDVEDVLHDLLARPDVDEVHVRASLSQCFTYAVRAG